MSQPAKKTASAQAAPKPSIPELARRWADAKRMEEIGKKNAAALRAELLAANVPVPYEDGNLVIREADELDIEDAGLRKILQEESVLADCMERRLSKDLVRAAAKFNDRIARAIERATTKAPRFLQTTKKEKE